MGGVAAKTAKLKNDHPYYHTTSELSEQLRHLAGTCKGATLTVHTVKDSNVEIEVAHIVRDPPPTNAVSNRVFFVSGEHARELIGPETNLRFLEKLCGSDAAVSLAEGVSYDQLRAADVLEDAEFTVVLNANPLSRVKVEEGDYCLRANPNGIDLNRNWDEKWTEPMSIQTDQGSKPFSEPETRLLKKLLTDFRPTTFLSIHSGTLGLYMPWAWSTDSLAPRNQKDMMRVLAEVDKQHCQCPYGAAGKEVGYPCPGTSVDWVYDNMSAPYSYAWEVWAGEDSMSSLRDRWKEKLEEGGASLLQQGHHLGHPHFREVFANSRSDFIGLTQIGASLEQVSEQGNPSVCFAQFNPGTEEKYKAAIDNWATAYMQMTKMITGDLQAKAAA
jgi:hypothetical protein